MTKDRRPYLTSNVLTQAFLDECADNLSNSLEMVCDIETPDGWIRASDRNKYVGNVFYEALLTFPTIERTLGEWLSPETEFSTLSLELSNADQRFSKYLPEGNTFSPWIGKTVEIKIGLRDVASTYQSIFEGKITDIGGVKRSVKSITITARDKFDFLSVNFPTAVFSKTTYPYVSDTNAGKMIPLVLGDWTTGLTQLASIPAFPVNELDPNVIGGTRNNISCVISVNALTALDTTNIYLRRSDSLFLIAVTDIATTPGIYNLFEIVQNSGNTKIDGENFVLESGDEFYCRVVGPSLSGYQDNVIAQVQYILETYAGIISGDYAATFATYKVKAAPAESAIANIKSRVWLQEGQSVITYVQSLLEQVRLELYINKAKKLALNSMHLDNFIAAPSVTLKNWDIERETFIPAFDEKNLFNRCRGAFNYDPILQEESQQTKFFRNTGSIASCGKVITKKIVFPNLYVESDVENQVKEILKLSGSFFENISFTATWRSMLLELGDFILLDVSIGSTKFSRIPCMIRYIGYASEGMKIPLRLFSMQMIAFPGWAPTWSGVVGGSSAVISAE